jgi:hypothetical protein
MEAFIQLQYKTRGLFNLTLAISLFVVSNELLYNEPRIFIVS